MRACSAIASATSGWAWPSDVTASPERKSRYSLALAVPEPVPSPRTNATGKAAVRLHHMGGVERDELVEACSRAHRSCTIVSDTLAGEELEQQGVRDAPVEDVRAADSAAQRRRRTTRSWGSCPPRSRRSAISCSRPADVDLRDQRRLVGPVAVQARRRR